MKPRPKVDQGAASSVGRWIENARAGNQDDLGRLLQGCIPYLRSIIESGAHGQRSLTENAMDLVQETNLRAVRSFHDFRGTTKLALHAWLRQILLHVLSDYLKKQLHWPTSLPDETELRDEKTPSLLTIQAENTELVQHAFAELDDDRQRILELRLQGKLSWASVGRLLGRSAAAVRMSHSRALLKLAHLLHQQPTR